MSNSRSIHQAAPAYHHVRAVAARQLCRRLPTQLALKGAAVILLLHLQLTSALRRPGWKESNQQQLQAKLYCCTYVMDIAQMIQSVWRGGPASVLGCFPKCQQLLIRVSHNLEKAAAILSGQAAQHQAGRLAMVRTCC